MNLLRERIIIAIFITPILKLMKLMKSRPCIVGIDFGTTSLSAVVIDINSRCIEKVLCYDTDAYIVFDDPARREQSVKILSDLFAQVMARIDELPGIEVKTYGFTGQMHGIIGLDAAGEAVTNLVTWQDRSAGMPAGNGMTILERMRGETGASLSEGYGIIALWKWINIDGRRDITGFCTVADYFARQLAGKGALAVMDATNAHSVGLFDIASGDWDRESITRLGLDGVAFPRVTAGPAVIGSRNTGEESVPVVCAIGDNQASFMGSVTERRHSILLNVGTGTQLSFLIDKDETGIFSKYIDGYDTQLRPFDEQAMLVATSFLSGGTTYRTLFEFFRRTAADLFGVGDVDEDKLWKNMEACARAAIAEGGIPEVSPQLDGTRSDPAARGKVEGLSVSNFTPGGLTAGFLRGLAGYYRTGFFPELEGRVAHICGSGNGLKRNALLRSIVEEVFQRPLAMVPYGEEAAVGAAVNAGLVCGVFADSDEAGTFLKSLAGDPR